MKISLSELATTCDWTLAGVTKPEIQDQTKAQFKDWLKKYKAPGLQYLLKRQQERLDPKIYFPGTQSILCFAQFYFPGNATGSIKISNYAWGPDYHQTLLSKLEHTAHWIQQRIPELQYRACVDTAPLLEKSLAVQAGLGWQGKNSLLIHPQHGSYLFLCELMTNIPVSHFSEIPPVNDHCGTCTRCLDACPTQALSPYVLDTQKCISYWNLEHRGPLPADAPNFHEWIAGCDICQEVCPWNKKTKPLKVDEKTLSFKNLHRDDIDSKEWLDRIKDRAINYLPAEKWQRNLEHLLKTSESGQRKS